MPNLGYTSPKFSWSHAKTLFPCRALWLSCGLTMDRMAGLQDLQDRMFWLNWGLFGQDYRIYRIYRIDCFGLTVG